MALKVDFLLKKELMYEARVRGIEVEDSTLVGDLRKKLRELVKLGVKPNIGYLSGHVVGGEEYEYIKVNLENLKERVEGVVESRCLSDIIRIEAKLAHYELRLKGLKGLFVSNEAALAKVSSLEESLNSLKEMVGKINIDLAEKDNIEQEITRNGEIEDEFEQSLVRGIQKPVLMNQSISAPLNGVASPEMADNFNCQRNVTLNYSRLPNPLERYLNRFEVTDGLNANLLIKFIKNMLALKNETKLKDSEILEIILGYANGPLYSKILKCKEDRDTVSETHLIILKQFVPMGLRENLKKTMVNRPQRSGEPLEVYINELKIYSEVLNTRYTEEEVVDIVKLGLNPETRAKLVFVGNPTSYADLDSMCIQVQNVCYNDVQRREVRAYLPPKHTVSRTVNNVEDRKTCFICNKYGHLARDCFQNKNTHKHTQQYHKVFTPPNRQYNPVKYNRPGPSFTQKEVTTQKPKN